MDFKSSQLSLTSLVQKGVLYCHEELTDSPAINAVVSRIAALTLSPTATIDLAFHVVATPISLLYAIGKSIITWNADFSLPWQHLQRLRETAFPIIFGTIGGIVHPYAGIYFTEPKDKHIAGGILLSNTVNHRDIVVSPVSAFEEIHDIMQSCPEHTKFPKEYINHVKSLANWEEAFEIVQSAEILDIKVKKRGMQAIYNLIDSGKLSDQAKKICKRVSLIAYPILAAIDITWTVGSAAFLLGVGALQYFGFKSPAYLETTNSPVFHVYSIARVIMTVASSIIGFSVSLIDPEKGFEYSSSSSNKYRLIETLLFPIFKRANREIKALKEGERLLLPIVLQNGNDHYENDLLPSKISHMTYLLVEKTGYSYSTELIERGSLHGIIKNLYYEEVCKVTRDCLRLRYFSSNIDRSDRLPYLFQKTDELPDLGNQGAFKNCVITNLFAAFDVMNHRDGGDHDEHHARITKFKQKSIDRYDHYQYDFFPFAPMEGIVNEIFDLKSKKI